MRLRRRSEQRTLEPPEIQQPPYVYVPTLNGTTVTPVTALMNVNVWACCRVLSDAAASCPLHVYRLADDGSRRRVRGRTAELLERPAEDTVQADLVSTLMLHLLLYGNGYLGKYRDPDGRVEQLLPIDPTYVAVERRAGRIRFTVTQDGRAQQVGLDDVIHVKALSSDGLVGLSPITAMRLAIDGDNAVQTASASLYKNNGRPSGILASQRKIDVTQAETIKDQWTGKHGADLAGGIAVFSSGDFTFTPIAMPADDAQFVEARKLSASEIARAFRVPPWMVGASDDSSMTYSNTESQAQSFATFSLQPWLRTIEQALSNDRDLFGPSTFAEFLIDALLRADSMTRAQVYEKALDPITGWMRRDEVRRAENLAPEPDTVEPVLTSPSEGAFA
jgi:HK97 family phage portal protein